MPEQNATTGTRIVGAAASAPSLDDVARAYHSEHGWYPLAEAVRDYGKACAEHAIAPVRALAEDWADRGVAFHAREAAAFMREALGSPARSREEVVRHIAERQGLMEADGEIWIERCEAIAITLEDYAAVSATGRSIGPGATPADGAQVLRDRLTEAVEAGRRATLDPGRFVARLRDDDGDYERVDLWQKRAMAAAVDSLLATQTSTDA